MFNWNKLRSLQYFYDISMKHCVYECHTRVMAGHHNQPSGVKSTPSIRLDLLWRQLCLSNCPWIQVEGLDRVGKGPDCLSHKTCMTALSTLSLSQSSRKVEEKEKQRKEKKEKKKNNNKKTPKINTPRLLTLSTPLHRAQLFTTVR